MAEQVVQGASAEPTGLSPASIPGAVFEPKDVWCIWTKKGHRPRVFHETRELAEQEAQRLASANPGKSFIVMRMVGKYRAPAEPVEA